MRSTALFIAIVFVFLLATSPTVFAGFGQKEHYFPQYAIGGPAETHLTVHNPGQTPITVEIELRRSDGSVFLTDTVQLDPGATETCVYRDPSAPPVDGWAKLTSQDEFTATLFYRIPGTGNVGVLSSSKTEQLKLLTFVGQDTDTALAIANPSATNDCNMTFSFYDQAGRLQRQETTSLGALGHDAFFVTEAPYAVGANGSILIEATEPVVALALRLDRQLLASTALLTPMGAALLPGAVTTEYLADGVVTGNKISDRTITGEKIANNQVVRSLNGLQDSVELVAGPNVMITPSGQQLTISSTNPGGDITAVDAGTGLEGGGLQGAVGLGIADGGVGPNQLAPEVSLGRVQAGPSGATANIILGFSSNHVVSGVGGAAIGGGGSEAGSSPNQVTDHYGTVAGGESNRAGNDNGDFGDATHATVGGGHQNTAGGQYSTVAGGYQNYAQALTATIGGGVENLATNQQSTVCGGGGNSAFGLSATVGGGTSNLASGDISTISGGKQHLAAGFANTIGGGSGNRSEGSGATVGGGFGNIAGVAFTTIGGGTENQAGYADSPSTVCPLASGAGATVGGGERNSACGTDSTVPGGYLNQAHGHWSFAAGRRAKAHGDGTFVWADSNDLDFTVAF